MEKVAIVILNWNGQKMLAKYLPNVIEYSRQDAEIWVADNSSSDGSMHLLETQFPQVKTIVLEQNFGFAEGYNRALKQIDAEYYVLLIEHEETVADIGVGNGAKLEHFLYQRTGFYRVIGVHLLQG
jgi:GT2 family glycosyltransferase